MKLRFLIVSLILTAFFCFYVSADQSDSLAISKRPPEYKEHEKIPDPTFRGVEDFKKYSDGQFPKSWRSWPLQRDKVHKIYKVKTEGDKHYVRAFDDQDISQQIMLPFIWDIEKYPYINWKWRPKIIPTGATEADDKKNDSACGVYVIFGRYTGVATKYVWSTSLPVGTRVVRREGKLRMDVVGTGSNGLGKWHSYSVNVPKSYQKLFEKPMERNPTGIAILTDGNATHTPAECDYTDFAISKEPMY